MASKMDQNSTSHGISKKNKDSFSSGVAYSSPGSCARCCAYSSAHVSTRKFRARLARAHFVHALQDFLTPINAGNGIHCQHFRVFPETKRSTRGLLNCYLLLSIEVPFCVRISRRQPTCLDLPSLAALPRLA